MSRRNSLTDGATSGAQQVAQNLENNINDVFGIPSASIPDRDINTSDNPAIEFDGENIRVGNTTITGYPNSNSATRYSIGVDPYTTNGINYNSIGSVGINTNGINYNSIVRPVTMPEYSVIDGVIQEPSFGQPIKAEKNKRYEIDYDQVHTIEDIILLLMALLPPSIYLNPEQPGQYAELLQKGLLKVVKI